MHSTQTNSEARRLEARFARAARHSRLVRALRVGIPAIVGTAMTAVVVLSLFNPFRVLANVSGNIGNLVISGTKITMESPHMAGFSADGRPYDLVAKTAVQDIKDTDNVGLTLPRAKMTQEDGSIVNVESRTGHFNNKTQMLELFDDVIVKTSTGTDVRLKHALVDVGKGSVTSNDGVHVAFEAGSVSADRLKIAERGEVIRFEGRVVMDLDQTAPPQQPVPAAKGARPNDTTRAVAR